MVRTRSPERELLIERHASEFVKSLVFGAWWWWVGGMVTKMAVGDEWLCRVDGDMCWCILLRIGNCISFQTMGLIESILFVLDSRDLPLL